MAQNNPTVLHSEASYRDRTLDMTNRPAATRRAPEPTDLTSSIDQIDQLLCHQVADFRRGWWVACKKISLDIHHKALIDREATSEDNITLRDTMAISNNIECQRHGPCPPRFHSAHCAADHVEPLQLPPSDHVAPVQLPPLHHVPLSHQRPPDMATKILLPGRPIPHPVPLLLPELEMHERLTTQLATQPCMNG